MASTQSPKLPRMRKSRMSLAHVPSKDVGADKENLTVDSAALSGLIAQGMHTAKKARSQSIGPGGLDALKEGSGNKQDVSLQFQYMSPLLIIERSFRPRSNQF